MKKKEAMEKIMKTILSCQSLKQLEVAEKVLEHAVNRGIIDFFEVVEFHKALNSKRLEIGDIEMQLDLYKNKG